MTRNSLMFNIVLRSFTITLILYYFNMPRIWRFSAMLFTVTACIIWVMVIVSLLTHRSALKKGTPILGIITKRTRGWKLFGEYEVVLHVTYTDGSHMLMTEKCNTYQGNHYIYPLNTYVALYSYKGDYYIGKHNDDVRKYFEDVELETLSSLIEDSDIHEKEEF